jgi:hypothetical protein
MSFDLFYCTLCGTFKAIGTFTVGFNANSIITVTTAKKYLGEESKEAISLYRP